MIIGHKAWTQFEFSIVNGGQNHIHTQLGLNRVNFKKSKTQDTQIKYTANMHARGLWSVEGS